jgi:predicted signal transduction protein with EAL and GGDEF domain
MWTKKESHSLERLGGDEFTVLLTNLRDVQDAGTVARRIVEVLANPFLIEGREIFVTISMGIAVFRVDGESVDALLKNADSAMYQAKEKGRNNFQFYCNNLNAAVNERLNLEGEQRHAVGREDFKLFYQPQIDLRAGEIIGAEALVGGSFPSEGSCFPRNFFRLSWIRV